MSTSAPPLGGLRPGRPFPERTGPTGSLIYRLIATTDHKVIGIRSERPAFELHYPHMIERIRSEAHFQRVRVNTR